MAPKPPIYQYKNPLTAREFFINIMIHVNCKSYGWDKLNQADKAKWLRECIHVWKRMPKKDKEIYVKFEEKAIYSVLLDLEIMTEEEKNESLRNGDTGEGIIREINEYIQNKYNNHSDTAVSASSTQQITVPPSNALTDPVYPQQNDYSPQCSVDGSSQNNHNICPCTVDSAPSVCQNTIPPNNISAFPVYSEQSNYTQQYSTGTAEFVQDNQNNHSKTAVQPSCNYQNTIPQNNFSSDPVYHQQMNYSNQGGYRQPYSYDSYYGSSSFNSDESYCHS